VTLLKYAILAKAPFKALDCVKINIPPCGTLFQQQPQRDSPKYSISARAPQKDGIVLK